MHTRRVGAFLVGAWLLGSLLVWFLTSQSYMNVDRLLSAPPPPLAKEMQDAGQDFLRQLLRYQATQYSRHVNETWEVIQLGIGGALLATSIFTAHRSRFVIISTLLMLVIAALMGFVLTPTMNSLARSLDLLPPTAALSERESLQFYQVWHRVLEILKTAIGFCIAARLLFDRYHWRDKLVPRQANNKVRRMTSTQTAPSMQQPQPPAGPAHGA